MQNRILVVGDCHISNDQDLSRFVSLGNYIRKHRPDYVVLIGDFLTLECLSAWDRDKRLPMEGKRYNLEINAGNTALDLITLPIKASKKKQPNWIFLMGNHEDRLTRFLERDPTFLGAVGIEKDLKLQERGFKVIPYRDYHYIDDIGFTHIPHNKVAPITASGMASVCKKATHSTIKSVVFGHTHELEVANLHVEGMEHLQQTLNCGCFFEQEEDYVHGRITSYWKGIIELHSLGDGRFDINTMTLSRLKNEY